jgi:hypothetical protein
MSIRYTPSDNQPASDTGEERPYPAEDTLAEAPAAPDSTSGSAPDSSVSEADIPTRPTFTARTDSQANGTVPSQAPAPDDAVPDYPAPDDTAAGYEAPDGATGYDQTAVAGTVYEQAPDAATGVDEPAVTATAVQDQAVPVQSAQSQSKPAATSSTSVLNEPLLSDPTGLRQQWQQVQAEFVDDPQEAVGHAADLIEQTTQTLVETLRQRQQELRAGWDDSDKNGATSAEVTADTERLRQMMRSYRALFDQLTRP